MMHLKDTPFSMKNLAVFKSNKTKYQKPTFSYRKTKARVKNKNHLSDMVLLII